MTDVLEVVKGLQQAAANAYDGALDDEGNPVKAGLRREEGSFLKDSRIIDGFSIKLQDNKMILNYQTEMSTKDIHDKRFENKIEQTMADVVKFLKKEYKNITGSSVKLTKKEGPEIQISETSHIRRFANAQCVYEIEGIKSSDEKRTVDNAIKDWIKLGKGGK